MADPTEYRDLDTLALPGYRVGADGSLWSRKRGGEWRRLGPGRPTPGSGQVFVSLRIGSRYRNVALAVLVLRAFVGPKPPGCVPRHLNDDPADCRPANLAWEQRRKMARRGAAARGKPGAKSLAPPLTAAVATAIRGRRVGLDLSPEGAAASAGLYWQSWLKIERGGQRTLTLATFLRVCLALDCEPAALLPADWRALVGTPPGAA